MLLDTADLIVFQTKDFGYDPRIHNPTDFRTLYDDLCNNIEFCTWVRYLMSNRTIILDSSSQYPYFDNVEKNKIHEWMSENNPVWSKRFNILLSVICSGTWDKWDQAYEHYKFSK